jgi:3-oxoacyl-[acyl-carrier protein] reductase
VTTIVIGPADPLTKTLTETFDNVVVIDGHAAVNETIWHTLVALQTARSSMAGGGRILLIVPTIGMVGAAGLVDYTTAIEGIRSMAKSAARQWGSEGIAVNMIAAPLALFAVDGDASHLTAAAVQNDATLTHSIVEAARFLLRSDLDHLTGETIVVDGGSVMLP